uniref:Uncharacterized protein n=1 Tax=Arundo donax TaxID=35708 RepID=A0A0A9C435_ARUDO
MFTLLFIFFI